MKIKDFTNKFNPDIIIPYALNFCYGRKHKIEIGFGNTYFNFAEMGENLLPVRNTSHHLTGRIGYRYQNKNDGSYIRVGYTPILEYYKTYLHWGGVAAGYSF